MNFYYEIRVREDEESKVENLGFEYFGYWQELHPATSSEDKLGNNISRYRLDLEEPWFIGEDFPDAQWEAAVMIEMMDNLIREAGLIYGASGERNQCGRVHMHCIIAPPTRQFA